MEIFDKIFRFCIQKAGLLLTLKERLLFVLGLSVFTILFIVLFIPFNISEWIVYTSPIKNYPLLGLGVLCSLLLFISQIGQFLYFRKRHLKNFHLSIGFFVDVLTISIPLSLLYSVAGNSFFTEFIQSFNVVFPVTCLGYVLGFALLGVFKATNKHQQAINRITPVPVSPIQRINISDANGQLKLSLKPKDILFIEAADNYIIVFHRNNDVLKREIIRNTIKNLEAEFLPLGFIRCHRSFLVNLYAIFSFKKSGRSYLINFEGITNTVPVSRNYVDIVKESLLQTSPTATI